MPCSWPLLHATATDVSACLHMGLMRHCDQEHIRATRGRPWLDRIQCPAGEAQKKCSGNGKLGQPGVSLHRERFVWLMRGTATTWAVPALLRPVPRMCEPLR